MKKNIDKTLLKEWHFSNKTDWVVFYKANFKAEVSYQKDCVLTCCLNDIMADDYFEEDTITSKKHLKIKIKYAQTILSQLHYNKIS